MRKNNTIIIVLIAGIFLILLLAAGTLGYAVFTSGSKTAAVETTDTEKEDKKSTDDTGKESEKTEKKDEKPKQSKVTLDDLKNKTEKNTEYSDNLGIRTKHTSKACYQVGAEIDRLEECGSEWDEELNAIYPLVMKKLTPSQQEELKTEQRKWIKQRDAKLDKAEDSTEHAYLFFDLTLERTYELAKLYDKIK